jgi:hypothetical protein
LPLSMPGCASFRTSYRGAWPRLKCTVSKGRIRQTVRSQSGGNFPDAAQFPHAGRCI